MALQKLPHFLSAYKDLSEVWEAQGKPKEAEKALLAGLTVSPNSPLLVQPLAWFYQKQKNYSAAEKILLAELKEHPDDLESRFRLGAIYRNSGRIDAAVQQFSEIVARKPEDPEAHNQLGMMYGATNRLPSAIKEFEKAATLAPENEAYRKNLELAKSKMGTGTPGTLRFQIIQTKTKAVADVIYKKLQKGETWEMLAKNYSIHPSARSQQPVLEVSSSEVDPAIAEAVSGLKTGQFSVPIQTSGGFFLLLRVS